MRYRIEERQEGYRKTFCGAAYVGRVLMCRRASSGNERSKMHVNRLQTWWNISDVLLFDTRLLCSALPGTYSTPLTNGKIWKVHFSKTDCSASEQVNSWWLFSTFSISYCTLWNDLSKVNRWICSKLLSSDFRAVRNKFVTSIENEMLDQMFWAFRDIICKLESRIC